MKRILLITVLSMLNLLNAEWLSTGKGSGESPNWNEIGKTALNLSYSIIVPGAQVEAKNEAGGFKLLTIPGSSLLREGEGLPKIPVVRELLAIPNCTNVQVMVTPLTVTEYDNYRIYPNGKMVNHNGMLSEEFSDRWQLKYDSLKQTGNYPAVNYRVSYPGFRGQRLAELELYPVQFNAQTNKIVITSEFLVSFTFTGSDGLYSQNLGIFSGVADGNFKGFQASGLTASVNTAKTGGTIKWITSAEAGIDYLMIVADQLEPPFEPTQHNQSVIELAQWRADYNSFNVAMIRQSDICKNGFKPDYEEILQFIKNVYSKGGAPHTYDGRLGYVCLIGDYQIYSPGSGLPPSYAYVGGEFIQQNNITVPNPDAQLQVFSESASDYYYSCLTNDLLTGKEDDYGDLFIGRIPAGDATELATYVTKVKGYEPINTADANTWRKKIWFINGDPELDAIIHASGDLGIKNIIDNTLQNNYNLTLATTGSNDIGASFQFNQVYENVVNNKYDVYNRCFNDQQWLTAYFDHGSITGWKDYNADQINGVAPYLENGNSNDGKVRLPFIFSNACSTGGYDYNPISGTSNNFAEFMLCNSNNGAIGMIANPRFGYSSDFISISIDMFSAFMQKRLYQSGEFLLSSKIKNIAIAKRRRHSLFGDPALNLMFDQDMVTKPDLVASVGNKDNLRLKYKSLITETISFPVYLSNIGNKTQTYLQNVVTIAVDNPDTPVNQALVNVGSTTDSVKFDLYLTPGWHEVYVKIAPLPNSQELNNDNNIDIVRMFVGRYQTGFPVGSNITKLFVNDYNNDAVNDLITDNGIYNLNGELTDATPVENLISTGYFKYNDLFKLSQPINEGKIQLESKKSGIITCNLPVGDIIYQGFIRYIHNSNLDQVLVVTKSADELIFSLLDQSCTFKEIARKSVTPGTYLVSAIADFDGDGLLDIAYSNSTLASVFAGVVWGNGTLADQSGNTDKEINRKSIIYLDLNKDGIIDKIEPGYQVINPRIYTGSVQNGQINFNNLSYINMPISNIIAFNVYGNYSEQIMFIENGDNNSKLSVYSFMMNSLNPPILQTIDLPVNVNDLYGSVKISGFTSEGNNYLVVIKSSQIYVLKLVVTENTLSEVVLTETVASTDPLSNKLRVFSDNGSIKIAGAALALHFIKLNIEGSANDFNFLKNNLYSISNLLHQNMLSALSYNLKGIWYINESLTIPQGQTLTIAPNTKLLFSKGTTLTVDGNLTINALADKPVVFCSQIPSQQWEGIKGNGTNSINLNNVIIRDAVTGIAGFNTATIQNSKFYDCGKALDLINPSIVNLTSSSIKDCTEGVSIYKNSTANRISYTISDCRITGKIGNNERTTGITISNIIIGTTVIERNYISNFHYGLCLNYGNARLTQNDVSSCYTGVRLFESSPVLYGNKISNNSYGIYTIGYSSPVLNPFGSAATSGGYNRISNNTDRQLYYDTNSGILLNDGHNDIFADQIGHLLVDKPGFTGRTIMVRTNYWGENFIDSRPNLFFNPSNSFVFIPYSTTPYTVWVNPQEAPADEELNTFDLALKKELADDSEAAYTVYQQALSEDSLDAKTVLPRLEYNSPESDKGRSDVVSDLFTAGKINSFIFSSAKARESVLNKNYTEASSYYLMKLDSADLHNDSLIAKVNLLDIIWQDQGKGAGKAAQLHSDLVCRTEKEYLGKREDLLAELSGEKTGISSENLITDFNLFQNYPNPFNPTTIIRYALPEPGDVKIRIYNIMGALVSELKEGVKNRGLHSTTFNGNKVSAGVYIYTLDYNGKTLMTKKMIMVK